MNGTVKMVNAEKGFGFIRPDRPVEPPAGNKGTDVFFHCTALPSKQDIDTIEVGARVSFDVESADDGRQRAANVQYID